MIYVDGSDRSQHMTCLVAKAVSCGWHPGPVQSSLLALVDKNMVVLAPQLAEEPNST